MKTLKQQIQSAKTDQELRNILQEMPKQENGERTQLYKMLDDAFWYSDLTNVDKKKNFMFRILSQNN
jgi:hypothetical protein